MNDRTVITPDLQINSLNKDMSFRVSQVEDRDSGRESDQEDIKIEEKEGFCSMNSSPGCYASSAVLSTASMHERHQSHGTKSLRITSSLSAPQYLSGGLHDMCLRCCQTSQGNLNGMECSFGFCKSNDSSISPRRCRKSPPLGRSSMAPVSCVCCTSPECCHYVCHKSAVLPGIHVSNIDNESTDVSNEHNSSQAFHNIHIRQNACTKQHTVPIHSNNNVKERTSLTYSPAPHQNQKQNSLSDSSRAKLNYPADASDEELDSFTDCSDFDRCSLDYDHEELGYDSSEEELAMINCNPAQVKRKWSQVARCNSCDDISGSSDDESNELVLQPKPLKFGTSPPEGVQRLGNSLSPELFLENILSTNMRLCSVAPRKRCRRSDSADLSNAAMVQRPCLDFEKMQLYWRRHNAVHRRQSLCR